MTLRLLNDFSRLFVAARPQQRSTRLELALLATIVLAGAVLRFWGLGAVGLHGDEETMAMPTMHIVEHGTPLLPSGMFYARAIAQLYLMAASVELFGESEWAFRLPSALCGVLLIALSFFVGRRFLAPRWSLALAAAVAFLPEFIIDSQTARMYVFMVTCIAVFLILLFRWERSDRIGDLIGAVLALVVGLQFHTLAVFSALLLFFPGLLRGDLRKLLHGAVAFAAVSFSFVLIDAWVASFYPQRPPLAGAEVEAVPDGPKAGEAIPAPGIGWLALAFVAAAAFGAFLARGLSDRRVVFVTAALFAGALLAQLAFAYHAAALLGIAALVLAQRQGGLRPSRWLVLGVVVLAIAGAHAYVLQTNGVTSVRQMLGAMTGWPSVWPALILLEYSLVAALFAAAAIATGLWQLAHRRAVPDYVLFLVLGVWLPLLLIGLFMWYIPLRYVAGQSLPLLVGAFAAAQAFFMQSRVQQHAPALRAAAATLACVLVINPVATSRTINAGYAMHPDHKGAAEFLKAQGLGPNDIVIAEDVLQQTYYLGHVDYWLIGKHVAARFVHKVGGEIRDFYTNSRLVSTSDDLQALVTKPERGAIYIVGSGENQQDGRRHMRGSSLASVLESQQLQVVYEGRDGLTKVWKVPPPARAAARE